MLSRILLFLIVACLSVVPSVFAQDCLVVFASNMDSTGGVYREDHSGADLYSIRFNPATKTVSELKHLTSYSDTAEWWPSLSPDTKWVAYSYQKQDRNEVRALNRLTGVEATVFPGGGNPEWLDNTELLVTGSNEDTQDIYRVSLNLEGEKPTVKATERITDRTRCPGTAYAADPYPFPDGKRMSFHTRHEGNTLKAAVATINLDGTGFRRLTDWDGSAHSIVSSTGQEIFCTSSTTDLIHVLKVNEENPTPIIIRLPLNGPDLAQYDSRFKTVPNIHWSFTARGADDHSFFQTAQGSSGPGASSKFLLGRLFYITCDAQWQNPQIFDFASAVEKMAGKSGRDFATASARVIPAASAQVVPNQPMQKGVVYVALFMHNEDIHHPRYVDFSLDENKAAYIESRNNLVQFCEMLHRNNAPFNWETDWNFLYGVKKWDTGNVTANTAGKNVVRYIHEDLGITVDPHSHENDGHNYTDVAHLIKSIGGVEPTSTIGGHIWDPEDPGFQNWERFRSPLHGIKFPDAVWKGDILIGSGTMGHRADPKPSGVWKPKGKNEYWTHDPAGTVYAIGQYRGGVEGVIELTNLYKNGTIPADKMLTATLGYGQHMLTPESIANYETATLKPLLELQSKGEIKIVTFGQLIRDWETLYGSVAHLYNPPAPAEPAKGELPSKVKSPGRQKIGQ